MVEVRHMRFNVSYMSDLSDHLSDHFENPEHLSSYSTIVYSRLTIEKIL